MIATKRIAVFEDNANQRERYAGTIQSLGMEPVRVDTPPHFSEIESFLTENGITGVISDHRLTEGHYADYLGAQLLKVCYGLHVGAVLLTSYTKLDSNTTLRIHRRWLPCVINADLLQDPRVELMTALEQVDAEVRQGQLPKQREPFRAVMSITRTETVANRQMVRVLIGQWNPAQEVAFPLEMVPSEMRHRIKTDELLVAQVNLDAENQEDLYFENFELPDADTYRESQAFFDHP